MTSPLLKVAERLVSGELSVPLFGQANLWIEDSITDARSAGFAQWCIQSALEGSAPGQVELIVFDDILSGLASGFTAINNGGERLLATISDQGELKDALRQLRIHIQGVNRGMRGLAPTLPDYRRQSESVFEGYKLVVLAVDVSFLDDETQNQIATLLKAGPRAGVSFLIHSTTVGANPYLVGLCDRYVVKGSSIVTPLGPTALAWMPPRPEDLIHTAEKIALGIATTTPDPISFAALHADAPEWRESSADGITFAIGRQGPEIVQITLGDELNQRHNMLITGAVGQGKSNLISVIIHSLCTRYSPNEVELYLLDFKEGVTLQRFAGLGDSDYLPHARVLGLEADREFALGLLRHLFGLYRERMKLFKSEGVQSLRQYRELHPQATLPRAVVVIDEFQMMFADKDRLSDDLADLLTKAVRLFRAAGIHVILASQTIGGNIALMGSVGEGLFGQVPVRVALKNSLSESHATLGIKNDEAAHLRAREAIVNLDYGDLSSNQKTAIAYADEDLLARSRKRWWGSTRDSAAAPYVFIGERSRSLDDDAAMLADLTEQRVSNGSTPVALLGATIEVDGPPLSVPFNRDVGRNVAVLGPGAAVPELVSIGMALGIQLGSSLNVIVLDLLEPDPEWDRARKVLAQTLKAHGSSFSDVTGAEVATKIRELAAQAEGSEAPGSGTTLVLALGLDRSRDLPTEFQDLCKLGPAVGVHVVGWWLKLDAFQRHVGYGGSPYFDTKVALRLDSQSTRQFMGDALLEWRPADNRALAWDAAHMVEPVIIIPYSAIPSTTASA